MEEAYLKKIAVIIILAILLVISFFMIKPILISLVIALLLAFIFNPVYEWMLRLVKSKNVSAFLICLIIIAVIVIPMWFLTPLIVKQSVKVYLASQEMDIVTPLKQIFPSLFSSEEFSRHLGVVIQNLLTKSTTSLMNSFSDLISGFAVIFLDLIVVFFTLFFILRDKDKFLNYVKSLSPFSKDLEKKLFNYSKEITSSILYGQVVMGMAQGIVAGIGLFVFKVPNALLLTFLACAAGVFPIIGATVVWIPVVIYLLVAGNTSAAIGVTFFGILSSLIENLLKPIFVSKITKINSSIILIGMIGGFFVFGILGFILGPLILAYLLILLEVYRNKRSPDLFFSKTR